MSTEAEAGSKEMARGAWTKALLAYTNTGLMKTLLKKLGLAEYGGDELFLATLSAAALGLALYLCLPSLVALVALIPWLIVVYFFRDPQRTPPKDPRVLLAPADGVIKDIERIEEPDFINEPALRIGIFLSPLNVHVNRAPCAGTVRYLRYIIGEFLPAYNPQAPTRNESQHLGIETQDGQRILVKQITGILARRIICEAREHQVLAAGQRFGMIKFGSRTELYVPTSSTYELNVAIGQKVSGGVTVLMKLRAEPHGCLTI